MAIGPTAPRLSDSRTTVNLLNILFGPTRGLGGSSYFKINTTYSDTVGHPTGNISLLASVANNYSRGKKLADSDILNIVSSAISSRALPKDASGLYFVLTTSDVAETSGFCTKYCGWHTSSNIGGADIKFAFVGNPDRCPSACEMQMVSPNGDSGADGMASIMVHEASEAVTDPDLNALVRLRRQRERGQMRLEVRAGHGYARTRCLQPDLRHLQLADPDAMGEQPRRRLRQSLGRQVL